MIHRYAGTLKGKRRLFKFQFGLIQSFGGIFLPYPFIAETKIVNVRRVSEISRSLKVLKGPNLIIIV